MKNIHSTLRILLTNFMLIAASWQISSQTITPSVFASGGGNGFLSYTIGETFTQSIENEVIITQGFQQAFIISTSLHEEKEQIEVSIYPNPFYQDITVKSESLVGNPMMIIYDVKGSMMSEHMLIANQSTIDLSNLPSGLYFISIRNSSSILYSTKINKR